MEERREQKTIEGFGRIFKPRYRRKSADGSRRFMRIRFGGLPMTTTVRSYGKERFKGGERRNQALEAPRPDLGRGIVGTKEERVTFEELVKDLKNDYRINDKRSLEYKAIKLATCRQNRKDKHEFFAGDKARHITTDRVRKYIDKRQGEGATNASINRELSALKRASRLPYKQELFHRPYIPMLEENNARQGFLDHGGFLALEMSFSITSRIQFRFYTCPVGDRAK